MPINERIVEKIKSNQENGIAEPMTEIIKLEKKLFTLQQMLIKSMQVNQETLLQVNKVMDENTELRKEISIMKRQIDFKQLQGVHAIK